jgi:hypothetical protein
MRRNERLQVEGSASSGPGSGAEKVFAKEIRLLKCRYTKRGPEHQEKTRARVHERDGPFQILQTQCIAVSIVGQCRN